MQLRNMEDVRCSLGRRRAWRLGFLAGQLQGKSVGDHTSEWVLAEAAILLRTSVKHLNASQILGIGPAIEVPVFHPLSPLPYVRSNTLCCDINPIWSSLQ